jgi:hypothetical protein
MLSPAEVGHRFNDCHQPDRQPCDDHFIKGNDDALSFDFDNAAREFDSAVVQDPKNAFAYAAKGGVALCFGRFEHGY